MKSCVIIVHEGTEYLVTKAEIFCVIVPVFMMKTGYEIGRASCRERVCLYV